MPIRPENAARYPKDWAEISRRIRFERAQRRCECEGECGRGTHKGRCTNVHGGKAYGTGSVVVLTVAHMDHTPEHCDDTNLRAMCQGCHLHYDRDHHAKTAYRTRREGKAVTDLFEQLRHELRIAEEGLANATQQINQSCTECGGTGWRIRKSDDAPVACVFCDGPSVNGEAVK